MNANVILAGVPTPDTTPKPMRNPQYAATGSRGRGEHGAKPKLHARERASLLGDEDRRQRTDDQRAPT